MRQFIAVVCVIAFLWPRQTTAGDVTPEPAASTALPVIGTTKARPLCAALRENLAPAIHALMQNDDLIASSKAQYRAMALAGPRQDLDLIGIRQNVQAMVKNLSIAEARLDRVARATPNPRTDDERDLAAVKSQLQEVAAKQTRQLDTINGVLEMILMKKMMGGFAHMPVWFATTHSFFADVAAAITEQQAPISEGEARLTPVLISISGRCGAAKP